MQEAQFLLKKTLTSWFSNNPNGVANFESIYPQTDCYAEGIRSKQPDFNLLLKEESGELFFVNQADIIEPSPGLSQLNHPSYITREPNRRLFSLEQGSVFGENGIVYDRRSRYAIAETVEHWNLPIDRNPSLALPRFPEAKHLPGITCTIASYGGQTFYHFLIEILPKIYFLQDLLPQCDRIIVPRYGEAGKKRWLEFVGVKNEIIWLKGLDHYRCDQLLFTNRFVRHFEPNPWAITTIRKLVKADLHYSEHPQKIVWASRKRYSTRQVTWEQDLVSHLRNFEEVDFGQLTPEATVTLCGQTRIFVGFHGAAFSNLVFCPPGCRVVEILVSDEEMWYSRLSQICGHHHTVIRVGEAYPNLEKLAKQIYELID